MDVKAIFNLIKETVTEFQQDRAPRLAAALAYFAVFAIGPLLLISIAIAGFVFGDAAAEGEIVGQIEGAVGAQAAQAIQTVLGAANEPGAGVVATIIGIGTLLLAASGLFNAVKDALNTVWGVRPEGGGIMHMVKSRLLAVVMVLAVGFLLLLLLFSSAAIATVSNLFAELLPGPLAGVGLQALQFLVAFGVLTVLFAVIYKVLPDAEIDWRYVWTGAAFTAFLFALGQLAIGIYFGYAGVGGAYGAAGSLVVLLVWVFYSAQIFLFGAEFTQVYARRQGARIQPSGNAVLVTPFERAKQGMGEGKKAGQEDEPAAARAPEPEAERAPVPEAEWQRRRLSPVGSAIFTVTAAVGAIAGALGALRGRRDVAGE
jgi:membrane protein